MHAASVSVVVMLCYNAALRRRDCTNQEQTAAHVTYTHSQVQGLMSGEHSANAFPFCYQMHVSLVVFIAIDVVVSFCVLVIFFAQVSLVAICN